MVPAVQAAVAIPYRSQDTMQLCFAQVGHDGGRDDLQDPRVYCEDRMWRAGSSVHHFILQQVPVDEHGQRFGVPERGNAADDKPRHPADGVRVCPSRRVRVTGAGQFDQIDAVGTRGENEHRLAVGEEDQRLHDLTDGCADRCRGLFRCARPLGKLADLDTDTSSRQRLCDALDRCGHRIRD